MPSKVPGKVTIVPKLVEGAMIVGIGWDGIACVTKVGATDWTTLQVLAACNEVSGKELIVSTLEGTGEGILLDAKVDGARTVTEEAELDMVSVSTALVTLTEAEEPESIVFTLVEGTGDGILLDAKALVTKVDEVITVTEEAEQDMASVSTALVTLAVFIVSTTVTVGTLVAVLLHEPVTVSISTSILLGERGGNSLL